MSFSLLDTVHLKMYAMHAGCFFMTWSCFLSPSYLSSCSALRSLRLSSLDFSPPFPASALRLSPSPFLVFFFSSPPILLVLFFLPCSASLFSFPTPPLSLCSPYFVSSTPVLPLYSPLPVLFSLLPPRSSSPVFALSLLSRYDLAARFYPWIPAIQLLKPRLPMWS